MEARLVRRMGDDLNSVMASVTLLKSDVRAAGGDPAEVDKFIDLNGLVAFIERDFDPIGRKFARP